MRVLPPPAIAAIVGKQFCSLGVLDRTVNRWAVGVGMIPRGVSSARYPS